MTDGERARQLAEAITALRETVAHAMVELDVVAELSSETSAEVGQLQTALDARVVIEQAKGMLAERANVTPTEAYARLRAFARNRNVRVATLAVGIVQRTADAATLAALLESLS